MLAAAAMTVNASAALPDSAAGGGVISEQINFSTPIPPILYTSPTLTEGCVLPCTTAWTFKDTGSNGGYVDDGGLFYPPASPLSISGSGGSSGFEDVAFGFGGFTSSASGSNNFGGSLNCSGIVGSYIRLGLVAAFIGTPNPTTPGATCTIDAQAVVPITFSGVGLISPPCSVAPQPLPSLPQVNCTGGRGVDSPISQANMQGAWSGVGSNSLTGL